jgi:arsenate reductase
MITVYGIRNCDTCRKALKWLESEGIEHCFHDFRKDGLADTQVAAWLEAVGSDVLLNRRGTTWRNLSDTEKDSVDAGKAEALIVANPTLVKRPVFEGAGTLLVGFGAAQQDALKG